MDLKDQILESMNFPDYKAYFEKELGEVGKVNTSGWVRSFCPFHNDVNNPNFDVNFFKEGAYNCHACGEKGDLFSFHMKRHGKNFKETLEYFANFLGIDPKKVPKKKSKSRPKKRKLGPPSAVYQYKDINGVVVYETCRYENPKDFRQRRPHPTKKNQYLWNLKGVEVIPYNLPAVAESDTIYIVEGEKDADRLAQIGLTATCNPMGAGKWWDSMTPYFKDKTVIILPDNDDPGRNHAELVAGKLKGTAKSIQVVNLPNLKGGEDVSDWLTAGNTRADLLELIKNQKPYEDHIDFLNKRHAVIMLNGKCLILNEETDPIFNRSTITFSNIVDLRNRYANRLIPNPNAHLKGHPKHINIATDWLKSSDRREYENIVFSPGNNINGSYNLWRGFAVEPQKGEWSRFCNHIFEVIADGKQDIFDWIITWMARMVQDPGGKRPGTALVLRGGQGVGKGCFLSGFGKLFGNHFLQVNNQKQLTGRFNNHFKNVLFLFVDEGFWAGDKAGEGILKGLVTEDTLSIEPKGRDAFTIQNHINLAMASNNDWVVPAGFKERRFMVSDVSDAAQGNKKYFDDIFHELKSGGYEAMLYDLLKHDTSKVDVSKIIQTAAGFDQIIESMDPLQKFWFERLKFGQLDGDECEWSELIVRKTFHEQYLNFCDEIGVRYRMSNAQLGKAIKKLCPGIRQKYLKTDLDSDGNYIRRYHYQFPPLETCRELFEKACGVQIDFDTDRIFVNGEFDGI